MPSTRHHSHDLNFKLKIIAKAEAFNKNYEIAHEYSISESMVRKWCNQQHVLFSGELRMTYLAVRHTSISALTFQIRTEFSWKKRAPYIRETTVTLQLYFNQYCLMFVNKQLTLLTIYKQTKTLVTVR